MIRARSTKAVITDVADLPGQRSISYDRPDTLRFYLQQAHKGFGATSKPHHHGHRLYRHGIRPKGFQDYNNIQWDPNIYRGRTFRDFREKNMPRFTSTINMNKLCCTDCNKFGKGHADVAVAPRKLKRVSLPRYKIGGIIRPTDDDLIGEDSTRRNRRKQDESRREMEPFIMEEVVIRRYRDIGTIPDETKQIPKRHCSRIATGNSIATQVQLSLAGTEGDPIKPIIKSVGAKVVEQSLMEAIEEYEIHTIRTDINKFKERQRLQQRREMKELEKELWHTGMQELEKVERENQLQQEFEAQDVLGARIFALKFCSDLLTNVFLSFHKQNYFGSGEQDVERHFHPWLHTGVAKCLQVPRSVLDGMIMDVETLKQAEALLYPVYRPPNAPPPPESNAKPYNYNLSESEEEELRLTPNPYRNYYSSSEADFGEE